MSIDDLGDIEWIPASQAFRPNAKRTERKLDVEVSKATGIDVGVNDPRVIRKVTEWKRQNPNNDERNDNWLRDPKKVDELRKALRS